MTGYTPDARRLNGQPPPARFGGASAVELLIALLCIGAELLVFGEGLRRELEHPGDRMAGGVVGREDGEDVPGGDACMWDRCREEDAVAEGSVGVHVNPLVALSVRAGSCQEL